MLLRLAVLVVVLAAPAGGAYEVGEVLEPFALTDQHGRQHSVDVSMRAILFTREMGAGDVAKQALAQGGAELLAAARAVYVSDLSGMPAAVRRLMALPRLRRRPYPILIDTDGAQTQRFPGGAGAPTLLVLEQLRLVEVRAPASPDELVSALRELAAAR
jgi:hypothetical protein